MADLVSCYFCGRVEDLGEYATPPARLLPPDHDPQSAVLCASCRGKLRRILEPVAGHVDALEAAGGGATAADARGDADQSDTDRSDAGEAADDPRQDGDRPDVEELAADAAAGAGGDTPEGYHRLLRLLRNRELPMARTEVIALASGAYDLDEARCETLLDAAIERGDLREDGDRITD
ncbi:MAG: hypothetical protein ABEJ06_06160 [Haloarculaceae archaeon]